MLVARSGWILGIWDSRNITWLTEGHCLRMGVGFLAEDIDNSTLIRDRHYEGVKLAISLNYLKPAPKLNTTIKFSMFKDKKMNQMNPFCQRGCVTWRTRLTNLVWSMTLVMKSSWSKSKNKNSLNTWKKSRILRPIQIKKQTNQVQPLSLTKISNEDQVVTQKAPKE